MIFESLNDEYPIHVNDPGGWDVCSRRLWMKFEISLIIWLMILGSIERPLVTPFPILM